ncbi:MAG: hypothetical protein V3U75_01260 [Methylococcaceae bacterium]
MSDKNTPEGITRLQNWKSRSENDRSQYEDRWVKNMNLSKGRFDEKELARSKVRRRNKMFFRKTWATIQRLQASLFSALLQEPDNFKIVARDSINDPAKARVLQKMTEYRRDVMMRSQSLLLKFLWGFQNILTLGWCVGLLSWEYDEETGKDGPEFRLYPNEQVYADFAAETKEKQRFMIFEDYMTKEEMEGLGYENIDKASPMGVPTSRVRAARYTENIDPLQNPGEKEYPAAGTYAEGDTRNNVGDRYRVYKCFYFEKATLMYSVTDMDKVYFQKPEESVYGDRIPGIMGTCLTEAHKMIGEGFPESMEGPQESYNHNLNSRKDNVSLALNGSSIVSRYGGVDLQSLTNSRPGGVVMADDVNAVKERNIPDVTQSAYMEANADDGMMQELAGITAQHLGLGRNEKATVAQINQAEGSAKIDMYIAIVGETFIRDFFSQLAYLIQNFETDETIFRIANEQLRQEGFEGEEIYDLEFEADCTVNVGLGTVGRQQELQTTMLAMDRAILSNQSMVALAAAGMVPPEGIKLFNTTAFMTDILPKLGKKDIDKYFVTVPAPPPQAPAGDGTGGSPSGATNPQNDLQAGGLGGI